MSHCAECHSDVTRIYGTKSGKWVCWDCRQGHRRCNKCRRLCYLPKKDGLNIYTPDRKGWYCWRCGLGGGGADATDIELFFRNREVIVPEPLVLDRKPQVCRVDFEEIAEETVT